MSAKKAKRKKNNPQKPPTSQKSLKCKSSNLTPPNLQPVLCKKWKKTVHMLKISCEDTQKLMEGGNDAGENVVAISEPVLSDVATTLNPKPILQRWVRKTQKL